MADKNQAKYIPLAEAWNRLKLKGTVQPDFPALVTISGSISSGILICFGFGCSRQQKRHAAALPPPGCGGEWKERGRNWWVGIRAV